MASWSAIPAISRFNYSAVIKEFSITSKPGNYFWSNGYAWGNAVVNGNTITISVYHGTIAVQTIKLGAASVLTLKKPVVIPANKSSDFTVK